MRHAIPLLLLVSCFAGASSQAKAQEEMILDESSGGVPVQTAILRRRYGPVATEQEVAGAELEAGYGATNLFKTIHWRRQFYRPWYGGFGWYGPRYYAGFGPRYVGYYPSFPYWPYWGGAWGGGWGGYGGYYGGYGGYYGGYGGYYGAPYVSFYAPPAFYGGYGGYGGCFYW
jgi:hypothetical protein